MKKLFSQIVFLICFLFNMAHASDFLVVEGKLTDSSGYSPIEDPSVDFTLSIYDDTANVCLLYKETFTGINMSGTKGFFSLKLGKGSIVTGNFLNSMNNKINLSGLTCSSGSTFNPTANSSRKLEISYNNGGGLQTLSQKIDIGASQFANYAYTLEGKNAAAFLQVNTSGVVLTQTNLESVFANASNVTELLALIAGTSSQYNSGAPVAPVNNNNQKIINVASPTIGTDAVNKTYADTKIGGSAANAALSSLSAGNSGEILTWNGTQWISSAPSGDSTKLPLAGGTMTGALNMGNQSITNSSSITVNTNATIGNNLTVSGGIGVTNGINSGGIIIVDPISTSPGDGGRFSLKELAANGINSVSLRSPDLLAADLIFTLPNADGTSGQLLQTNGAGVLSWISQAASGEINTASNQGTSGVGVYDNKNGVDFEMRNINAAADAKVTVTLDAANKEIDLSVNEANFNPSAIPNTAAGNIAATNVQSAINELDTEKVAKAGDTMSGALMIGATNELRLGDADNSNYVGFVSPAVMSTNLIWVLPSVDGTNGQYLQTDGSGNLIFTSVPASGETNTASNVTGTTGVGLWKQKTGSNLEFKSLLPGSTKLSVSGGVSDVTLDVIESNFNSASIPNTAAGNIAATNIQAAMNELDSEKVAKSGDTMTGRLNMNPKGVAAGDGGSIAFTELAANGTAQVGFRAPDDVTTGVVWSLPVADGTSGQVLQTNGSGILNWASFPASDNLGNHIATTSLNMSNNSIMNLNMGTAVSPSLSFNTDSNTGLYSSAADTLSFATNGSSVMTLNPSGNVGIGITTPAAKLDVNGAVKLGYIGAGACSIQGSIQKSGTGTDLMFCDGSNWILMAKQNPTPLLDNATVKDFAQSPVIYTTNPCSAGINLWNLKDGENYKLLIKSTTSGTCTFTAYSGAGVGALNFRTPSGGIGATTASYHTLFEFTVVAGDVYVKMINGL